MSKINTPPVGLQALLGSQSFGENPNELLRDVRPTVDLFPFWAQAKARNKDTSGNRNTAGEWASVLMGGGVGNEGEAGFVLGCSLRIDNVSGGNVDVAYAIGIKDLPGLAPGTTEILYVADGGVTAQMVSADEWVISWNPPFPFFIPNGASITARALQLNGSVNAYLVVNYIQIRAD